MALDCVVENATTVMWVKKGCEMGEQKIWMVRAGRGAEFIDDFIDDEFVGVGWMDIGDISESDSKSDIERRLKEVHTKASPGAIGMWASQIKRFFDELKIGDAVTSYDSNQRVYFLGEILSDVEKRNHVLGRTRRVSWTQKVPRDSLAASTRNTLGAISTLFVIKGQAAADMRANAIPIESEVQKLEKKKVPAADEEDDDRILMEEVAGKANEFIEDRIANLDWEQMQELVAEILTAMGYRARVSPKGPDRGVDIFASPDGLGLQEPRIFVEVKHRPGNQMGSNEVRAFLGGRQPGDRCLYVSTGGFSKEARYEADRSSIPITLITLSRLRELLVENYDSLSPGGTTLVPLERLYWPAS